MNTENKLPEDFKLKWVAALRSGKYKQCAGTIYNKVEDSFCCLGVAYVVKHKDLPYRSRNSPYGMLPDAINGGFNNDAVAELIRLNDSGSTFSEIADYIEENL